MNILKTRQPPAESLTPHITGEIVTIKIFTVMGFYPSGNSTKWVLGASFKLCKQGTQMAWSSRWALKSAIFKKPTSMPQSLGPIPSHFMQKCKTKQITSYVHVCVCTTDTHTPLTFSKPIGSRDCKEAGKIFTSPSIFPRRS